MQGYLTIVRAWKQPNCPSREEWMEKMWCIYTVEYYSSLKKNEIVPLAEKWMDLETVTHSKVREKQILYTSTYMWNLEK